MLKISLFNFCVNSPIFFRTPICLHKLQFWVNCDVLRSVQRIICLKEILENIDVTIKDLDFQLIVVDSNRHRNGLTDESKKLSVYYKQ